MWAMAKLMTAGDRPSRTSQPLNDDGADYAGWFGDLRLYEALTVVRNIMRGGDLR
jgi:hypothetical protein